MTEQSAPARRLEQKTFEKGDVIFQEGDAGDMAYIIDSGNVDILKEMQGETVSLARLQPGEIFGEMALVDESPRMASAVAANRCTTTLIPDPVFQKKLENTDFFIRGLIRILVNNLRNVPLKRMKRPRSLSDTLMIMDEQCDGLSSWLGKSDDHAFAKPTREKLTLMRETIREIRDLAEDTSFSDRRRHAYSGRKDVKEENILGDLSDIF